MKSYFIKETGEPIVFGKATPSHFSFMIVDEDGEPIKYFQPGRGKIFYLGIIRNDLNYFQHLHPHYDQKSGIFTVSDLKFPDEGVYRLAADFSPLDTDIPEENPPHASASIDLTVGISSPPPPPKTKEEIFGIFDVTMKTDPEVPRLERVLISFDIKIDEKPITSFQDHFGSKGHLSIFSYGTLDFEHRVAKEAPGGDAGELQFAVRFQKPGNYKAFLEFKHADKVTTGNFEIKVKR